MTYSFPQFMRDQRALHHWTRPQAAMAIGHSPTWIRQCEEGQIREPKPSVQREIALGFGVPLAEVRAALGLEALADPEIDALQATLDEVAAVLRTTDPARHPQIVEAARLIARVP